MAQVRNPVDGREGVYREDFDRLESRDRRRSRGALPPQSFSAKRTDGGILFTIIDRDPVAEANGAVRYDIVWAEDVDLSTSETVAAGFARATNIMSIPAPGRAGADAVRLLFGERFLRGFFFCVGVDSTNVRGEPTPPISMNDTETSGGYPDDVSHFSVSESGEVHNGVPYSVISFIYQAPADDRFAGVKFFVKDYPVTNQIYQTYYHRYTGERGGTGQDAFKLEVGRRKGSGTITIVGTNITGVGSTFLSEMNTGDLLEARGHVQQLAFVSNDTTADFGFGTWTGDDVTGLADWWIIPEVTFFAVSCAKDGTHRDDVTNAPMDREFLDGLLSPPVTPVLVGNFDSNGVSTLGEVNRLEWDQLVGTEIKAYHLYRGEGAAVSFGDCDHVATRDHNPHALGSGHQSIDDTDFTISQKEQNQVFSYYLVAENWREQRSDPSTLVEVACRLNNASSGDPTIPARSGVLNLLYDAALIGTAGNNVDSADASQDTFNNLGGPPTGWVRWHSTLSGGAATRTKHANNDQFKFVAPGLGGATYAYQDIEAFDAAANKIIREGAVLTLQFLIKHGGVLPDGTFSVYLEAYNAGVAQEFCPRRYRDPADDALKFYAPGTLSLLSIPGSDLLSTWQGSFGVFLPRDSVTTTVLRAAFRWTDGTVGEIYVTQPMLSYGEELCNWTGQMVDTALRYPTPGDPPIPLGDGSGSREIVFQPVP